MDEDKKYHDEVCSCKGNCLKYPNSEALNCCGYCTGFGRDGSNGKCINSECPCHSQSLIHNN